jgi:alkylated DNA repair dioxygenase AlkB
MRSFDLGQGATVELIEDWLTPSDAGALWKALLEQVPWETKAIRIAGRMVQEPRLTAWYGDSDAVYTYSGLRNVPRPWIAWLADLRSRLAAELGVTFNGALLNHYRDGRDSMGMHADNEPELGRCPTIASISLGEVRRFRLRHVKNPQNGLDLDLPHGSLLVMRGTTQHLFRHGVPKQPGKQARINITFRRVIG